MVLWIVASWMQDLPQQIVQAAHQAKRCHFLGEHTLQNQNMSFVFEGGKWIELIVMLFCSFCCLLDTLDSGGITKLKPLASTAFHSVLVEFPMQSALCRVSIDKPTTLRFDLDRGVVVRLDSRSTNFYVGGPSDFVLIGSYHTHQVHARLFTRLRVHSLVPVEAGFVGSTIPTALPLTGKRLLTRVHALVRNEGALLGSTIATALPLTGKRLLARVHALVHVEVALLGSTIPTALPLTGKRLLTRVRSIVLFEVALPGSTIPTAHPLTIKRLLARLLDARDPPRKRRRNASREINTQKAPQPINDQFDYSVR
jgi:hypothetical protein